MSTVPVLRVQGTSSERTINWLQEDSNEREGSVGSVYHAPTTSLGIISCTTSRLYIVGLFVVYCGNRYATFAGTECVLQCGRRPLFNAVVDG